MFSNILIPNEQGYEKLKEIFKAKGAAIVELKTGFIAYTKAGNTVEVRINSDAKIEDVDQYLRTVALDDRLW